MVKRIINGRFVTPQRIISGVLVVEHGRIRALEKQDKTVCKIGDFDAKGKYVLPGFIETHGHFREPGFTHKEDIAHGTKAALAGGFTTVFDMPNTNPPITTVDRLHEQIKRYQHSSYCDFAINFGSSVADIPELEKLNPREIVGVKVFMAGHQTTPTTVTRREDQSRIWNIAGKRGFPVLVHAEDQELVTKQEKQLQEAARTDMLAYSEARNSKVVEKAARIAVELAFTYGTKLWILHASTTGEFEIIRKARKNGLIVGGEVAGYQLFFTTDDYERLGTRIKVSPALRSRKQNKQLWDMVRKGVIDGLCSEHTPHTLEEKNRSVWEAVSGMPGIQETVPAFITRWTERFGENSIEECLIRLSFMAATNVAHFFGFPQKSGIQVGNDADLVVIDVENSWNVTKKDLFTKLQWSAYEGMKLIGRPEATFLRGELVYENGKIVGGRWGEWLKKS